MRNARRLTLAALCGSAAVITFAALAVSSASAHETGENENDRWQISVAAGRVTVDWNEARIGSRDAHPHPQGENWRDERSEPVPWFPGKPIPASPCDNVPSGTERSHCAYVLMHQDPWEVFLTNHPYDRATLLTLCTDVSGWQAPAGDLGYGGNILGRDTASRVSPGARTYGAWASCTDGIGDSIGRGRHTDTNFINQWGDTINAGLPAARHVVSWASPDQIVSRGHHHWAHGDQSHDHTAGFGATLYRRAVGPQGEGYNHALTDPVFPAGSSDHSHEHYNTADPTNHTDIAARDHKTVMFWVWWEHAADEEPEPEPEEAMFAPVVSVVVDGGFDVADGHGGTAFAVSFVSTVDGCGAVDGHAASGRYTLSSRSSSWATTQDAGVRLVGVPVGSSQQCRYTAGFPDRPTTAGSRLELLGVTDRSVSVRFPDASATYHVPVTPSTFFDAQVKIVVPSAQYGATITGVTIRPLPSLSPSLRSSCSPDATHSYAGSSLGAVRRYPELVDTPSGADERCSYQVRFPREVDVHGGTLKRTSTSATRTIDAAYPEALVGYAFEAALPEGTFVPDEIMTDEVVRVTVASVTARATATTT